MKRLVCAVLLGSSLLLSLCFAADTSKKQTVKNPDASALKSVKNKQIVLKGVVLDEHTFKPIPNLGIYKDSQGHKITVSDSKGEFKYPVPPGQSEVQILPWSPKVVGRSTMVKVDDFTNRKLTIFVENGMSVDVHAKDEDGKPVEKVSLLWMCAGGATGTTDKKGNATLTQVSRFRDGCLTATCPGYLTWNANVYAPLYKNGGINIILKKGNDNDIRNNNAEGKSDTDILLDEKELQSALLSNAKQIGMGLLLYAQDYDMNFPKKAAFEKDIEPYIKSMDVFRSPNGGALMYEYYPQPSLTSIEKPAETVLLKIDSGYDWGVVLYVDGHVKIVK